MSVIQRQLTRVSSIQAKKEFKLGGKQTKDLIKRITKEIPKTRSGSSSHDDVLKIGETYARQKCWVEM